MISVDDSTLFLDWISVFGSHQELLDGGASFAIHLYPKLSANLTLRCLGEKVVPVSIRLKSQVKSPKGLQIIRRAEISLLNNRIRSVNKTINMLSQERDTCISRLKEKIKDEGLFQECEKFIEERREARHHKTMSRQRKKLEALC